MLLYEELSILDCINPFVSAIACLRLERCKVWLILQCIESQARQTAEAEQYQCRSCFVFILFYLVPCSLGCGTNCDSSNIPARKNRCMWCAAKAS